jgi:hypothetical protein
MALDREQECSRYLLEICIARYQSMLGPTFHAQIPCDQAHLASVDGLSHPKFWHTFRLRLTYVALDRTCDIVLRQNQGRFEHA